VQSQQQFIANNRAPVAHSDHRYAGSVGSIGRRPAAQPIKERLLTLQEGIRQLAHSANQLLTLARGRPAANLAAKNQPVDLNAIVGEVVAKFFDRACKPTSTWGSRRSPSPSTPIPPCSTIY